MGLIKPLHSMAKTQEGKAAECRYGVCVCMCVSEGVCLCLCVSVCKALEQRAHGLSPMSDWQSKADIYMLRTNECNLCVGNGLIQLA